MKATALAESSNFIYFHQALSAPAMSTDVSQVGVALSPFFKYIFYHFTFPGFPYILMFHDHCFTLYKTHLRFSN